MSDFKLPEGAEVQADGSVIYPLAWPVSYKQGGADCRVESVTVRRKRMDDNLEVKKLDNGADIAFTLIQRLCGLDPIVAKQIDDVDQEAIGMIIESFTMPGHRIGKIVSG